MKYIIFESKGFLFPVIFPDIVNHCDVQIVVKGEKREIPKPISAGFFSIIKAGVKAFGESESLKLKSNPNRDANLIGSLITNHGSYAFDKNMKMYDVG